MHILFDTGAKHSYMSSACASRLGLTCTEGVSFVVGLPDGSRVSGDREIRQCPIGLEVGLFCKLYCDKIVP